MFAWMRVWVHGNDAVASTCLFAFMYVSMCLHISCMYVCRYVHARVYVSYTCIYTRTHTHIHMCIRASFSPIMQRCSRCWSCGAALALRPGPERCRSWEPDGAAAIVLSTFRGRNISHRWVSTMNMSPGWWIGRQYTIDRRCSKVPMLSTSPTPLQRKPWARALSGAGSNVEKPLGVAHAEVRSRSVVRWGSLVPDSETEV